MATSYLIDSNIIIDFIGKKFDTLVEKKLDDVFDHSFNYSIISRIEVLGYNATPEVLHNIENFLSVGVIHYLTDEVCDETISIRRLFPKIKLPDLIIATTAIIHNQTLLTRNTNDFIKIPKLQVSNPHEWTNSVSI
jgi:predicted nucleic acid-binding protein